MISDVVGFFHLALSDFPLDFLVKVDGFLFCFFFAFIHFIIFWGYIYSNAFIRGLVTLEMDSIDSFIKYTMINCVLVKSIELR